MSEPSNGDIMRALGSIEANQTNFATQNQQENQRASESRRVLHEKLEDMSAVVHNIALDLQENTFSTRVATDIAVQARDKINAFIHMYEKEAAPILEGVSTFRQDAEPVIAEVKNARNWIIAIGGAFGAFGVTAAAIVAFANQWAKAVILAWLNS